MAAPTIISLFSGAGFLDAAIRVAVPGSRTVCHVEREIPAAAILAARMEDGSLDPAPIWSDVTTFDGRGWRGLVDGIIGGSPCQDLSVAGRREGIGGQRSGLIEHFFRIANEVKPGWLFWENVGGVVSSLTVHHRSDIMQHIDALQFAADRAETPRQRWYIERHRERLHRRLLRQHGISALLYVQCRLEAMGYRVETGLFSAAEVGAPHKRDRLFVLAYPRCEHLDIQQWKVWPKFKGKSCELAHPSQHGRREGWTEPGWEQGRLDVAERGGAVGDTERQRRSQSVNAGISTDAAQIEAGVDNRPERASGVLENARCAERWPHDEAGGYCGKRDDGQREAASWAGESDADLADSIRARLEEWGSQRGDNGPQQPSVERDCLPLFPPGPGDTEAWRRILAEYPDLAPAVEPGVHRLDDEFARVDRLRAAGNGVVVLQAALAFTVLARRAGLIT